MIGILEDVMWYVIGTLKGMDRKINFDEILEDSMWYVDENSNFFLLVFLSIFM